MMRKHLLIALSGLVLVACTVEEEDLRGWMVAQERGMTGGIDPLPEMKPFPVAVYTVPSDALDPFDVSRIEPEPTATVSGGPDLDRPREPLEAYPLESLSMVGVLMQEGKVEGIVAVAGLLHQVKVGNYVGQDHGLVTDILESEIVLKELVQNLEGDWVERVSQLRLVER